jgi:hypothetical protein
MFDEGIVKLVNKWTAAGPTGLQPALRICRELIFFRPDPREREKKAKRKDSPFDWSTSLEPSPRFQDWEYAEFLDRGVRPLATSAPLATAKLLIEAVANMMVLDTGRSPDAVDRAKNDASEIWAPRVDERRQPYSESKTDLVRTLTFACEQVYQTNDQEQVQQVDIALREGRWYVFDRIRYHLYAKFPKRSKDWIREAILLHEDYAAEQFGFEFQRMIRIAIEQFGPSLLTKEELTPILEVIVNAPDKEDYKQFMAEQFSEEGYRRRQEYFQRRQLTPFAPALFGKYAERYKILVSAIPALTDDDFVRFGTGESKTGASRSPKGIAELASLTDDQLISFLNTWEDAHRDPKEWWVDIDFTGLANAFEQLILANPNRFLSWGERWRTLERPIYLRHALDAGAKRIVEHRSELSHWLDIADWIMTRMEKASDANEKTSETSRNHPNWAGARRQVVDFIAVCIKKDVNVDLEWRSRIFQLLKSASAAPDYHLDADKPIVTPRDHLTDAINTMRGRAIENLLQYGFWVKRHQEDAELSDVFDVLQKRFAGSPPLALAEYALLGASFYQLHDLNTNWTKDNVRHVFPQSKPDAWAVGFGAYLRWNSAHPLIFDLLNPHLQFAVEHLNIFKDEKNPRNDAVAHLGQHLLGYFTLGFVELDKGLLARFYARTEPKYWSALFDHLGRMLSKTSELKPEVAERCKAFFEARLAAKDGAELKEFTFWLKAECLEPKWRLTALLRILDITKGMVRAVSMSVEDLAKLATAEPDLAVECFAKLTQGLVGQSYFYLRPEHVKSILKMGLASKHEKTVDAATFALDNLLKAGRSEYRDLDAIKDDPKWL